MAALPDKLKFAVHFFDERGHSILSQLHLYEENQRLERENARLRELLARVQRRRIMEQDQAKDA